MWKRCCQTFGGRAADSIDCVTWLSIALLVRCWQVVDQPTWLLYCANWCIIISRIKYLWRTQQHFVKRKWRGNRNLQPAKAIHTIIHNCTFVHSTHNIDIFKRWLTFNFASLKHASGAVYVVCPSSVFVLLFIVRDRYFVH